MKIAIQGHPTRGKKVIQILESLGGNNLYVMTGSTFSCYYINNYYNIDGNSLEFIKKLGYTIYTLEEFEKEFPFKIGDEVTIIGLPDYPKVITEMTWKDNEIFYTFGDNTWYNTGALRKLEMKEERNITLTLDKAKEWYNKGGELKEIALQAFTEKELTKVDLPKSWEEFCNKFPVKKGECILESADRISVVPCDYGNRSNKNWITSKKSAEAHLAMIQLEQLRDCWRQGWKPKWDTSEKWCIRLYKNQLHVGLCTDISRFLTFPTRDMAEEFLECFRDLLKLARDLI